MVCSKEKQFGTYFLFIHRMKDDFEKNFILYGRLKFRKRNLTDDTRS